MRLVQLVVGECKVVEEIPVCVATSDLDGALREIVISLDVKRAGRTIV